MWSIRRARGRLPPHACRTPGVHFVRFKMYLCISFGSSYVPSTEVQRYWQYFPLPRWADTAGQQGPPRCSERHHACHPSWTGPPVQPPPYKYRPWAAGRCRRRRGLVPRPSNSARRRELWSCFCFRAGGMRPAVSSCVEVSRRCVCCVCVCVCVAELGHHSPNGDSHCVAAVFTL